MPEQEQSEQRPDWFGALHDAALEALDRGWSIFPVSVASKVPLISWKEYQTRQPTYEEVEDWFENGVPTESGQRVTPFNLGLVTGLISGVVVVDCDNAEAARYAEANGLSTPITVQTTRGRHYYFRHPGQGRRFANKAGGVGRDWPEVEGLDFRGDGGYVLMPPSVKLKDGQVYATYEWEFGIGLDLDDLDDWVWQGLPSEVEHSGGFDFDALDLEGVRVHTPEGVSVHEQTRLRVAHLGHKLRDGDGRNSWLVRFAGQKVREGVLGEELERVCRAYMDDFFEDDLPDSEVAAVLRSAQDMDRRNHPQDYDADGRRIEPEPGPEAEASSLRPVFASDARRLLDAMGETSYWVEPMLPVGTITQVVGYNGHGKSLFLGALLSSVAAGHSAFGPYETPAPARVFYCDYDNPARTVLHRMIGFERMFGDTGENLALWTPTLIRPEDGGEMNLTTEEGFQTLGRWVEAVKPDIVVIDTVRNAFLGMDEASPQDWGKVNHVAKTLRNHGCTVILVHHRNKPGEGGLGREAGSTAQLTDLDTQVMVTQVFREKREAKERAGLLDSDYLVADVAGREWTPYGYLEQRMQPDSRLRTVTQVSFGKVRQTTELHQTHYLGWCERLMDGAQYLVSTASSKQKAHYFHSIGDPPQEIARKLYLPLYEVRRWLGC